MCRIYLNYCDTEFKILKNNLCDGTSQKNKCEKACENKIMKNIRIKGKYSLL